MVISEFLEALGSAFPKHRDQVSGMAGSYKRVLGSLGPAELRSAWESTIDAWEKTTPPPPAVFARGRPHKPEANPELGEATRLTRAAMAERKALVDRTLHTYAHLISEHRGRLTGWRADCFVHHLIDLIRKAAWPLAVSTAKGEPAIQAVEVTAQMIRSAHDRVTSQGERPMGNIAQSIKRKPNAALERQRAQLRELAERYRDEIDGAA